MLQLEPTLTQPFRILIVVAHPDDVEFGAGGSVAHWTASGAQVVYCIVTDGSAGSNDPNVNIAELIERRKAEQIEAAAVVGVQDVRFLGYPDGALEATIDLRRQLTRIIRDVRPNRVVLMDPTSVLLSSEQFDYINHPDHRATGEATLYAVFPSAETRPIFPELLAEGLEPHHVTELYVTLSEKPNIAVNVTPYIEQKIQSLLLHSSQLDASVSDMIRGWDAANGKEAGVEFAEVFRVLRFPVNEPAGTIETIV